MYIPTQVLSYQPRSQTFECNKPKKSTKRKNDVQEINAKQETFTLSLNNLFIEEHSLRSTDHCCKAEHNILSQDYILFAQ